MASIGHSYGPSCLLHTEPNSFIRRASRVSLDAPPIRAQFFYCSSLPIDDPLSPIPSPQANTAKATRLPPRPFSIVDNRALESAWLYLHKSREDKNAQSKPCVATSGEEGDNTPDEKVVADSGPPESTRRSTAEDCPAIPPSFVKSATEATISVGVDEPTNLVAVQSQKRIPSAAICKPRVVSFQTNGADAALWEDPHRTALDQAVPVKAQEIRTEEIESGLRKPRSRSRSPFHRRHKRGASAIESDAPIHGEQSISYRRLSRSSQKKQDSLDLGSSPAEHDTTGTPFLRAPSRTGRSRSREVSNEPEMKVPMVSKVGTIPDLSAMNDLSISSSMPQSMTARPAPYQSSTTDIGPSDRSTRARPSQHGDLRQEDPSIGAEKLQEAKVVTGISRLHVVEMPSLKMRPIYWDPINDISSVVRGTWFYKETMWPVESELANQLEEGYEYVKSWTPTYVDELNSCEQIGPEAELKVVHRIWPSEEPLQTSSRSSSSKNKGLHVKTSSIKLGVDELEHKSAILAARKPRNKAAGVLDGYDDPVRLFARSSIIFANAREGQILSPSQLPSVARGRKPLAKIRKGQPVGVTVVRGFDFRAWEKLYPPKQSAIKPSNEGLDIMRTSTRATNASLKPCSACLSADETPKVTDLVLVIHGIGQKLSERVESFHFTHAINAFRRQVNVELQHDAVKPWLREEGGSIMILPINWRSKMKLDDGGPEPDPNRKDSDFSNNQYSLSDIVPDTLPAVRNLISDVMLDIPYYLSHHKPKMVAAVVKEANRIYRLWCNNNQGFHGTGRVHLIAHSLGSVMALDILSKQPTKLPTPLDFKNSEVRTDMLEFDTNSLFFCGSPAGFFLLLNRAPLLPRRGRNKPDADGKDESSSLMGEAGTYGCLAVDNLYNILHENDPVANLMNACVDVDYSNSLKQAYIPSTSESWGQFFGSLMKRKTIPPTKTLPALDNFSHRPSLAKLPSTVEMETHNFSREEIAEKRMFLLNDNGQIDYILRSGGGPLEIQYINMLSAHSSYWVLQDFVRFLVVEIGRKPGKSETLGTFRPIKKAWAKKQT